MCGITGFWGPSGSDAAAEAEAVVRRMAGTLAHRGPDDQGSWVDPEAGVALGHRRLAILDLSQEGHQPMVSADGRYVLVFNGEIYNFRSLQEALVRQRHSFRGHSDTEVMLAAFCEWGVLPALERFVGMFAFALWDRRQRRLHLARDRAGEKPLYYGWTGNALAFGSELKALRAHPQWRGGIDRRALGLLVRYGYIPAPLSIYEQVFKLPPGGVLTLGGEQVSTRRLPRPQLYWSVQKAVEAGAGQPFAGTEDEASERLRALLLDAVAHQMVADVPLGAFLSGGVDSSLVVALMQAQSSRPIRTFSIGFEEATFDEAPFAREVARHLGTDHTELYVQPRELEQVIPRLPAIYDEPLADPSQVPTYLVCRLARQHVKVSLSGDAGDELFGGYEHYRKAQRIWKAIAPIPGPWRGRWARWVSLTAEAGMGARATPVALRRWLSRVMNFSDLLGATSDRGLYQRLSSPNRHSESWLKDGTEPAAAFDTALAWEVLPGFLERMMGADFVSYLPDDILVKVDRAAMSVSLETRIPLLDHRIIEFACRLPSAFKQRGNQGKWLLRRILRRYVPPTLVDRPKTGFAAPIADWLRGPLREWAGALLAETRLRREGFFEPLRIRQAWREHQSGARDWSAGLWHVLMFQAWAEQQGAAPSQTAVPLVLTA